MKTLTEEDILNDSVDWDELKASWQARDKWREEHYVLGKLAHSWEFVKWTIPRVLSDWKYEVKYAWQRVFRGYDDAMVFSFSHRNAQQTLEVLKHLQQNKMGFPIILLEPNEKYDWETDADHEKMSQRWDNILDKMIKGFEAFIAADDVYITDGTGRYLMEDSNAERLRLQAIWEEGAALFIKYYGCLWD